jgi:hypothetical protein
VRRDAYVEAPARDFANWQLREIVHNRVISIGAPGARRVWEYRPQLPRTFVVYGSPIESELSDAGFVLVHPIERRFVACQPAALKE